MIISITEDQLYSISSYANTWDNTKHDINNIRLGKCGEVAFHNYIENSKVFSNFYGNILCDSILKETNKPDNGYDFILQSKINKYVRIFTQIKTISGEHCHNIPLDKEKYDNKTFTYYTGNRQDIFILIRKLSESTYDILGFITTCEALRYYKEDVPVKDCYCIHEKYLHPIEELDTFA